MFDTRINSKDWASIIVALIGLFGTVIETGNSLTNTIFTIIGGSFILSVIIYLFVRNKFSKVNPNQHSFFTKIPIWKNWIKTEYYVQNKVRKMIFQDILFNVVKIYEIEVKKFIEQCQEEKNETLIKNKFLYTLNQIIEKIARYYHDNDTNYSEEDKITLAIIIEKFLKYHTKQLNDMRIRCIEIILDDSYGDIRYRLMAILILFDSLIVDMLRDIKLTADTINGALDGKKFRNETI